MEPRAVRIGLRAASTFVMLFLYLPLLVIVMQAFSASPIPGWPIGDYSTRWFRLAWHDQFARTAFENSVTVGLRAAAVALVLGSCIAFALSRFRFFGQNTVSLLFVLPIALPGIVTGLALLSTIDYLGITPSLWTVVAGHATFCIVVVFNNVVARLRRTSTSFEEASADLGAKGLQTFRYVVFPQLRSALVAGALLAFALSFDEIIVTTFTAGQQQTLPIWIFANLSRPRQLPIVNVVAVLAIVLSLIPVWIAQRITADPVSAGAARGEVGGEAGA